MLEPQDNGFNWHIQRLDESSALTHLMDLELKKLGPQNQNLLSTFLVFTVCIFLCFH